ncbi:MAG: hypothetical protein KKA55_07970 [Proteobacteria bacterium]|nr:hypothetical protein [Pseudomonadota bacterium]MBU1595455.1 hypothetical protein [Pseudomonadota bacterium]
MTSGDVALIPERYLPSVPHDKYILCICPVAGVYFYINTDKRYSAPETTQIPILGRLELEYLNHTSYIDTSSPQSFDEKAITNATIKGQLPNCIRKRIKDSLPENELLTPNQIHLIQHNL